MVLDVAPAKLNINYICKLKNTTNYQILRQSLLE